MEVISVTGLGRSASGHLSVTAANTGDTTLITLTVSPDGDEPVRWSATTAAPWLYLSRSTGTLGPGESITLKVYVDPLREPSGHWHARVAVAPAGAVVSIEGYGTAPGPPPPATAQAQAQTRTRATHPRRPTPTRPRHPRPPRTPRPPAHPLLRPEPHPRRPDPIHPGNLATAAHGQQRPALLVDAVEAPGHRSGSGSTGSGGR